jgi:hypothetical protein
MGSRKGDSKSKNLNIAGTLRLRKQRTTHLLLFILQLRRSDKSNRFNLKLHMMSFLASFIKVIYNFLKFKRTL